MTKYKAATDELEIGQRISPFGTVTDIRQTDKDIFAVTFESGRTRNFRQKTKWWVDDPEPEKETEMVSHRRRSPSDTNPLGAREPELEDYIRQYDDARKAVTNALQNARTLAPTNIDQATLFLHEATVQAQLAQAASGMATAVATRGQAVEIRVTDNDPVGYS